MSIVHAYGLSILQALVWTALVGTLFLIFGGFTPVNTLGEYLILMGAAYAMGNGSGRRAKR